MGAVRMRANGASKLRPVAACVQMHSEEIERFAQRADIGFRLCAAELCGAVKVDFGEIALGSP